MAGVGDKLMQIEDPIEYPPLAERGRPPAPKYFIVAGGDERYPPDSTRFYLNKLPGEVSMRAIAGDERTVPERAVLALVNRRQRDIALPTIEVPEQRLRDGAAHAPLFRAADQGVALDCA